MPANEQTPSYYKKGGAAVTPIDLIDALGLDFNEGSVIKYVSRWRQKGGVADLRKARWYIDHLIEQAEATDALKPLLALKNSADLPRVYGNDACPPGDHVHEPGQNRPNPVDPKGDGSFQGPDEKRETLSWPTFFPTGHPAQTIVHTWVKLGHPEITREYSPALMQERGYEWRRPTDGSPAGWHLKRGAYKGFDVV